MTGGAAAIPFTPMRTLLDHRPRRRRPHHRRRGHRPRRGARRAPRALVLAPTAPTPSARPSASRPARTPVRTGQPRTSRLAARLRRRASAPSSSPSRSAAPPSSTCSAPARSDAEELTELPGAEQFALLRALRRAAAARGTDLVVVDLPPLHQTVATLALPAQLRRYLRRLLPAERQAARALRPVLAQLAGVPMPAQWLYEAAARWDEELAAVQAVVEAADTGRTAGRRAGTGRAPTPCAPAASGSPCTSCASRPLVANRLVPQDSADPWLAGARRPAGRSTCEAGAGTSRALELAHLGRDPRGPEDLAVLAAADGARTPDAPAPPRLARRGPARRGRGARLGGPAARRPQERPRPDPPRRRAAAHGRARTAGSFRCPRPCAAAPSPAPPCADGVLRIRFTPDPGLWPRTRLNRPYRRSGTVEETHRTPAGESAMSESPADRQRPPRGTDRPTDDDAWAKACAEDLAAEKERRRGQEGAAAHRDRRRGTVQALRGRRRQGVRAEQPAARRGRPGRRAYASSSTRRRPPPSPSSSATPRSSTTSRPPAPSCSPPTARPSRATSAAGRASDPRQDTGHPRGQRPGRRARTRARRARPPSGSISTEPRHPRVPLAVAGFDRKPRD